MPPLGFEPTISAEERPQTYALDRAATGTVSLFLTKYFNTIIIIVVIVLSINFSTTQRVVLH